MTLHDFLTDNFGLTQALMVAAGVLLLLAGGKLSQTLVRIIGFLIGGAIGAYLSLNFTDQAVGVVTIIGFLVGGLIGTVVALFLAGLGMFLVGIAIGVMSIGPVYSFLVNEEPTTLVVVAGALIVGILFVGLHHFWVTGITSFIGAVLLGSAFSLDPVWWAAFFALGLLAQYTLGRRVTKRYVALPKNLRVKTPGRGSDLVLNEAGELVERDPLQMAREQLTAGIITAKEFKKIKRKNRPYREPVS